MTVKVVITTDNDHAAEVTVKYTATKERNTYRVEPNSTVIYVATLAADIRVHEVQSGE